MKAVRQVALLAFATSSGEARQRRETNWKQDIFFLTKDCDMFRLLLLFFVVTVDQHVAFGKPLYGDFRSITQVDFSDSAEPANTLQAKRNSYHATQASEILSLADPSSLCFFIQDSDTESQITCRLRFTRSKFNFNPFGLRFGKRQEGIVGSDAELVSQTSGKILQALLKLGPDRMVNPCGDSWAGNC
uniref:Uncharacterized protein n=1 Tax=Sphaerodactylus townsendi TaxID=933632 RepID=A0ACB8FLP1_9SAUR